MNHANRLLMTGMLAGWAITSAPAQNETTAPPAEGTPPAAGATGAAAEAQAQARVHRATILQGSRVENHLGDRLGRVSDLLVDLATGEVAYLLIREGLTTFAGDARVVPPESFKVRPFEGFAGIGEGVVLTVQMDEQTWDRSPTVNPDRMGELGQQERAREIYQFHGRDLGQRRFARGGQAVDGGTAAVDPDRDPTRPQDVQAGASPRPAAEPGTAGLLSVDELIRATVTDAEGRKVGRIDDMIIDLSDGQLAFVVVLPDTGLFERADSEYAVAPQAITQAAEDRIQLNLTQQQMQSAQVLTEQTMKQEAAKVAAQDLDQLRKAPAVYRLERSGILGN
jgi:sporulation protein YlmC with PRC-barrel domain